MGLRRCSTPPPFSFLGFLFSSPTGALICPLELFDHSLFQRHLLPKGYIWDWPLRRYVCKCHKKNVTTRWFHGTVAAVVLERRTVRMLHTRQCTFHDPTYSFRRTHASFPVITYLINRKGYQIRWSPIGFVFHRRYSSHPYAVVTPKFQCTVKHYSKVLPELQSQAPPRK